MSVEEMLSPALQAILARQGTRHHGFEKARASLQDFGFDLTSKRVERVTERIGGERVGEREAAVAHYEQLTLTQRWGRPA